MKQGIICKAAIGVGLFLITGFALLVGNETILPTALVLFILYLQVVRSQRAAGPNESRDGRAARYAIITFALFFAILSLLTSIFLPSVSAHYKLDGLYDGDFVRVTINDMHEFCYSICLLLALNGIFLFCFRKSEVFRYGNSN